MDELIEQFGKAYILENKKAIYWSLEAIAGSDKKIESTLKDLIYTEVMLFGSYRKYCEHFIDFYRDEIDETARKKIEPMIKFVDAFLRLIEKAPIQSIYKNTILLKLIAEDKAEQLNNDIFAFLKKNPLSYSFDYMRASEYLEQIAKTNTQ